ncbi:aminofutalosine synthase MqnE [Desulfohalobiaceae bacterium Ax17]|uniref:aminofutalosine synthase MqnE n=1 Tax=Desulfovulcanus ferrireducens TaxID=2831190 RepID=UPI00207BB335|nr:aminofutalosine synthase MqnE [Desulfovulcanus ferrireducens]MBT8762816.1 aminofutalosine synthase MqnE [Desulfovulcanus ferrireducens]
MNKTQEVIDKVSQGLRISLSEALELVKRASIHDLGSLAYQVRSKLYGQQAFYIYNQHINYTNICQNACRFCAYSKSPDQDGAYTYSIEQIKDEVRSRIKEPITEIHIVGGLNPDLPYSYYLQLLKSIKEIRPDVKIKAFTAVEIAFLAQKYGISPRKVLHELHEAGLDALPGGGAEVFDPKLRQKLCPEKISGKAWLDIHREAHKQGIPTNCTMLFGHIETWEDRLNHLQFLRDLQDESGGFLCFIPLPYQPANNNLKADGPDGLDFLRMIAISRIFLDNIPHIKAYWVFAGIKAAQLALWYGADDFDGTIVEEKIGHAAGADTPRGLTVKALCKLIQKAEFTPVERDTFFNVSP